MMTESSGMPAESTRFGDQEHRSLAENTLSICGATTPSAAAATKSS